MNWEPGVQENFFSCHMQSWIELFSAKLEASYIFWKTVPEFKSIKNCFQVDNNVTTQNDNNVMFAETQKKQKT